MRGGGGGGKKEEEGIVEGFRMRVGLQAGCVHTWYGFAVTLSHCRRSRALIFFDCRFSLALTLSFVLRGKHGGQGRRYGRALFLEAREQVQARRQAANSDKRIDRFLCKDIKG